MSLRPDTVVQTLLRERVRIATAAVAVVRDAHAADDIFQTVVLTALQRPSEFSDADHLIRWAVKTARHRAVDAARGRQMQFLSPAILDLLEAELAEPEAADPGTLIDVVRGCVGSLPTAARELLRLRFEEGLTVSAVAGKLGQTVGAVTQWLVRVQMAVRRCAERKLACLMRPVPQGGVL
jgi:RNA polymerase sigma-70 factor (ECF subfamily)